MPSRSFITDVLISISVSHSVSNIPCLIIHISPLLPYIPAWVSKVDSLFANLGAVYMEKFQPGLRFHPGCWRMEKSRIIWNTECVLIYELLLFKLFSSFQSVNSRAENSPCNQPLNLTFKANSPTIWIYVIFRNLVYILWTNFSFEVYQFYKSRRLRR